MNNIRFLKKMPEDVVIPLCQHNGAVCKPLVSVGDTVLVGQRIGEAEGRESAPVYASVSGTVAAIEELPHPFGTKTQSIVITVGEEQQSVKFNTMDYSDPFKIKEMIKDAGIVEIYGTPTCEVIENIDTIIVNATYKSSLIAGCVGLSTYTDEVYQGLKFLLKASGAKNAIIAINRGNNEAFKAISSIELDNNIKVMRLGIEYTPGMENLLVYDATGRTAQIGGKPEDAKVAICGVNTTYEVDKAVTAGRPSMYIPISVSGAVKEPQSILVPIGMRFRDVIERCGGYEGATGKVIMNGLTIGIAQYTDEVPVVKQTAGILVQDESEVMRDESQPCIHCARCVDVCPVDLIPSRIATLADQGRYDECREMHVMNCVECGKCAVECPSKIHLLQLIWYAKKSVKNAYCNIKEKETSNLKLGCCGGD